MDKFEWYYFDVHTNDGYDIIITLHTQPFMSTFNISIIDCFIYHHENLLFHHFFIRRQENLILQTNPLLLKFDAKNYLIHEEDDIELSLNDNDINLNLKMSNKQVDHQPIITDLYSDLISGKTFNWILYIPGGKANGNFTSPNLNIPIRGRGYHDYNSGNINFKKTLKGWRWAKYYLDDYMLITGEIINKNNTSTNLLVKISESDWEIYKRPDISSKDLLLQIKSDLGNYIFKCSNEIKIDDIQFLINTFPPVLKPMAQIREIMADLSLRKGWPIPFKSHLINSRYHRYRKEWFNHKGGKVTSFQEEMFF